MARPNNQPWLDWDFSIRAAANRVNGVSVENKYAFNAAIDTTPEDVWIQGGVLSFLTAAETMSVVSGDAADKGTPTAGTGARTIKIWGVDDNYRPVEETLTLNGTTPVVTSQTFLRINRMRVLTAGSSGTNVGDITATASSAATVQASVGAELGSTLKSQYTVPTGYYAFIRDVTYGTGQGDQVQADIQTRNFEGAWIVRNRTNFAIAAIEERFSSPLRVGPKADIRIQAAKVAGTGTVITSASYSMFLVQEDLVNPNSIVEAV